MGHSAESGQIGDWKSKIFNIGKFIEIVMDFQDKGMYKYQMKNATLGDSTYDTTDIANERGLTIWSTLLPDSLITISPLKT